MRLVIFEHGWWRPACEALSLEAQWLAVAAPSGRPAYAASVADRLRLAESTLDGLMQAAPRCLLDNGGTGMSFTPSRTEPLSLDLLHERLGVPHVSHFVDSIATAMQGLPWSIAWQSLQSPSWIKAVWDRAHARELTALGVPSVVHLPMAAPNRDYDITPLRAEECEPVVSFVGGQNTTYFAAGRHAPTASLLPGVLAEALRSDLASLSFYDAYHDVYKLATPVTASDDPSKRAAKAFAYFNAKLFFHAMLCVRQRDRFVLFLKKHLGSRFRLIGNRWLEAYGIEAEPPLPTAEQYFEHFRRSAINLNLVNGNAETGLNMRHFEITAAGGFMLCHRHPELEECFVPGRECAVFTDEHDLLEKIDYYLAHGEERTEIALAGQRRTLSEHLFSHRLASLLRLITEPDEVKRCEKSAPRPVPAAALMPLSRAEEAASLTPEVVQL